eukprot:COSAG06_NODE_3071_length_5894_cov_6.093701_4_plen_178_part_00
MPLPTPLPLLLLALLLQDRPLEASAQQPQPRSRPCAAGSNNSKLPFCDGSRSLDDRVSDLIGRLTLEEKIGELTTGNGVNGGSSNNAIPRLSIPAWDWWSEGTHGVKGSYNAPPHTVFPFPITTAMAFNRSLWHATAQHIAREGRSEFNEGRFDGLTYWAPVINLARDPRWGRNIGA